MDRLTQQHWQMHRYVAYMTNRAHGGKDNPVKIPTDLFELEIDSLHKGAKKDLKFITIEKSGAD